MPPKRPKASTGEARHKKIELTEEELQGLIERNQIIFEGPQREKYFPGRCKHLFQAIRRINRTSYEEIKRTLPYSQKSRVKDMRDQARRLRTGANVLESDWRLTIENNLLAQFQVAFRWQVCTSFQYASANADRLSNWCNGERYDSASGAVPFAEAHRIKVQEKHSRRNLCNCGQQEIRETPERDNSDDESHTVIFETATGGATTHGPEDDLDAFIIPMSPDRIIGLRRTDRYSKYIQDAPAKLAHTCMKDKWTLLYPFLVLEAKRERSKTGFSGIGLQTAFPLRRMLQTQQSLLRKAGDATSDDLEYPLDPLVWFLCNQGELWKLHAATIEGSKVRIFELWVNNVESEDGAFQLIQIVNFIWTWARDVFRPQVRSCLRTFQPEGRQLSPTSTNYGPMSQPIIPFGSLQAAPLQSLTVVEESDKILAKLDAENSVTTIHAVECNVMDQLTQSAGLSATWATRTSIRNSDLVACTYSFFEIPSPSDLYSKAGLQPPWSDTDILPTTLRLIVNLSSHLVSFTRRQIRMLRQYWIAGEEDADDGHPCRGPDGETVRVLLLFRTFCEPSGWQITRELLTLVYQDEVFQYLLDTFGSQGLRDADDRRTHRRAPSLDEFEAVMNEVQKVRNLTGRSSVFQAFQGTRAILSVNLNDRGRIDHLTWTAPPQRNFQQTDFVNGAFTFFEILAQSTETPSSLHNSTTQLLYVIRRGAINDVQRCPFQTTESVGKSGAVIAIRPNSWPAHCPRFCLFVFEGCSGTNKANLARLLEETLLIRDFYREGQGSIGIDERDRTLLKGWLSAMKE